MLRSLFALLVALASGAQARNCASVSRPNRRQWTHYHNLSPNNSLLSHIFESLVGQDERQRLTGPRRVVEGDRRHHMGVQAAQERALSRRHAVPADDVIFGFERAPNVEGSPRHSASMRGKTFVKVDDHTLHVKVKGNPIRSCRTMYRKYSSSRRARQGAKTPDYNSGKAAIGTGPYRFVEYTPGNRIVVQRNDEYWGEKPVWQRVTFRGIKSDPSRVAALLAAMWTSSTRCRPSTWRASRRIGSSRKPCPIASSTCISTTSATTRRSCRGRTASRSRTRCATCACAARSRWRSTATRS